MEKEERTVEYTNMEEAFGKLEGMIEKLSDKKIPLEEAFTTYKEGMQLVKTCQQQIDLVEKQVLMLSEEGDTDAV